MAISTPSGWKQKVVWAAKVINGRVNALDPRSFLAKHEGTL